MMTQDELNEYFRTPGPKRDRSKFARHSIEETRLILESIKAREDEVDHPSDGAVRLRLTA